MRCPAAMLLLLIASIVPAAACRDPQSNTSIVLEKLPARSDQQELVAKVELVELIPPRWPPQGRPWDHTERVRARVVQAIKGVRLGEMLVIDAGGTSCDESFGRRSIGQQGFIVGAMTEVEGEAVFATRWRFRMSNGELVRAD